MSVNRRGFQATIVSARCLASSCAVSGLLSRCSATVAACAMTMMVSLLTAKKVLPMWLPFAVLFLTVAQSTVLVCCRAVQAAHKQSAFAGGVPV